MTHPEGLYLRIDREVDGGECDRCHGNGWVEVFYNTEDRFPDRDDCPICHGTGRVERRLVGWVEVSVDYTGRPIPFRAIAIATLPERLKTIYYAGVMSGDAVAGLCENIVRAHLSGILPPEVAAGLEEREA
jgi:hypothetical protein